MKQDTATKSMPALDAKLEAQKLAFGPIYFQCMVALRDLGILENIRKNKGTATVESVAHAAKISKYGVEVLTEAGDACDVIKTDDNGCLHITKTGIFVLMDKLTEVNINFVKDVCYGKPNDVASSVENGKPKGLEAFGKWNTVYQGLSQLPEKAKKSWFAFDHYYSDDAFLFALDIILQDKPKHIIDIGGNTGRFALACLERNPKLQLTICDLPGQIKMSKKNLNSQVNFHAVDVLQSEAKLPKNADAIWMSQFLDCFSETEIVRILKNINLSYSSNTSVYILEPFVDNQNFPAATYALAATSLYFTAIANGNSKMYSISAMRKLLEKAGMKIEKEFPLIGDSFHTLLKCRKY